MFDDSGDYGSLYIITLVRGVIEHDHVIQESCDIMGRSPKSDLTSRQI